MYDPQEPELKVRLEKCLLALLPRINPAGIERIMIGKLSNIQGVAFGLIHERFAGLG